jgi:hypothetical protein
LLWLEQREVTFNQTISLDGKTPLPHYGLGIIYQRQGKNSKIIGELKQFLLLSTKPSYACQF